MLNVSYSVCLEAYSGLFNTSFSCRREPPDAVLSVL